jgi:isoleucyl-tRNA synthetase
MSTMMEHRRPFKTLLGHGLVRDQKGEEMHKSKGNAIPFDGAVDTGFRLFHEREPKLKLEAQAHRDLPEGWLEGSLREETIFLENKPTLVVSAGYQPMGADEIRWLFCRHNPALNINFGPEPAEELRSRFLLKLWNTYAFFCNYARLDKFDPAAPQVPVGERPDLDRWILSDLQLLIKRAREWFDTYNLMAFCTQAEQFVDDKLSNWYVRRNRRRFWKSEQGADKQAAYQTLHTVLTTLAKLFAPIMPFVTEAMWRNLVSGDQVSGGLVSVHHCDYPEVDETLIDADLSADMEALLRLVSRGSAARNTVKIKVRQPLAELRVQPADERDRRAVERFADQICEELNVKWVALHDVKDGPLVHVEVKPNPKTLGPKFGPRLKEVQEAISKANPAELAQKAQAGESVELHPPNGPVPIEPGDLLIHHKARPGWTAVVDRGSVVALNTTITDALKKEGLAREVVRSVQNVRKQADLQLEDRIILYLGTASPELSAAIQTHREYIMAETLTVTLSDQPLGPGAATTDVKIDGHVLRIELRKV